MEVFNQIATKIIEQQQTIIGPVAIEQAKSVSGLKVNWDKKEVTVSGNGAAVIDKLVAQYKELFGKISVEVCKEAASKLVSQLPDDQQPKSLK
jgi:hypothetical protein